MKTTVRPFRRPRTFLLALVLSLFLAAPAAAAPVRVPLAAIRSIWSPIEWAMGSQRRMLQVATVGMCLAIYIILWRK